MAKPTNQRKPTKEMKQSKKKQPQKPEKPPSWAVVRGIFTCKHLQQQGSETEQMKQLEKKQKKQIQQQGSETEQMNQLDKKKKKEQQQQETVTEETRSAKKSKKMKCSGSLCSNTKVMQRPEASISLDIGQKKRASLGSTSYDSSSRSMKGSVNELNNGVVSSTNSSFSASSNSSIGVGSSFRGMPFSRFSGCYECRMVVDPVLGFTRDPSLRASICSCPDCGEIFMKPENLELHQAVRHAGTSYFQIIFILN